MKELLIAFAIVYILMLFIIYKLMKQTSQREKLHRQRYPQASKPVKRAV